MLTKEILYSTHKTSTNGVAIVEKLHKYYLATTPEFYDSLISLLDDMHVFADGIYLLCDVNSPGECRFFGKTFDVDFYDILKSFEHADFILYKLGKRLCIDVYGDKTDKCINHFEIFHLTEDGCSFYHAVQNSGSYSFSEMIYLFSKSPKLADFIF